MGNPLCGHPRASEGSFPSAFSPAVSPLLFPRLSAAAPTAGEIGARPDFLCGPAAARATRRPGPRGATNCTCGGPGRPGWHRASLATPLHPRPFIPPTSTRPFPVRVSASRKSFTPSRVPDKPSHTGACRPGARTPRLGRGGGAWWGGSAGEVFKLEPELPSRGSGSRGAVERPCASSGRDPGVWRGVGRGGQVCAKCAGAARERSGGRAEPGRSRPAGEAGRPPRGTGGPAPLSSTRRGAGLGLVHRDAELQQSPPATAPCFARGARVDSRSLQGS